MMDLDSMGALEVLKEIKALMDERLGSKLAEPKPLEEMDDAKGLEVSKVKVLGKEPEEEMMEEKEEEINPELLKKIRESLV